MASVADLRLVVGKERRSDEGCVCPVAANHPRIRGTGILKQIGRRNGRVCAGTRSQPAKRSLAIAACIIKLHHEREDLICGQRNHAAIGRSGRERNDLSAIDHQTPGSEGRQLELVISGGGSGLQIAAKATRPVVARPGAEVAARWHGRIISIGDCAAAGILRGIVRRIRERGIVVILCPETRRGRAGPAQRVRPEYVRGRDGRQRRDGGRVFPAEFDQPVCSDRGILSLIVLHADVILLSRGEGIRGTEQWSRRRGIGGPAFNDVRERATLGGIQIDPNAVGSLNIEGVVVSDAGCADRMRAGLRITERANRTPAGRGGYLKGIGAQAGGNDVISRARSQCPRKEPGRGKDHGSSNCESVRGQIHHRRAGGGNRRDRRGFGRLQVTIPADGKIIRGGQRGAGLAGPGEVGDRIRIITVTRQSIEGRERLHRWRARLRATCHHGASSGSGGNLEAGARQSRRQDVIGETRIQPGRKRTGRGKDHRGSGDEIVGG